MLDTREEHNIATHFFKVRQIGDAEEEQETQTTEESETSTSTSTTTTSTTSKATTTTTKRTTSDEATTTPNVTIMGVTENLNATEPTSDATELSVTTIETRAKRETSLEEDDAPWNRLVSSSLVVLYFQVGYVFGLINVDSN